MLIQFFFVIAALAALKAYPGGMQAKLFSKVLYIYSDFI